MSLTDKYEPTPEWRAYYRDYYHKNKAKRTASNEKYRQRKLDAFYEQIKSKYHCSKCPETHPACLDFHHRDPSTKEGEVVEMVRKGNLQKALLEADKCDVLCSNCHRKLHFDERNTNI